MQNVYDRKQSDKLYREKNKEILLAKNKEYRETHKEEIKITKQKYRESHKEEIKEYRLENKEKLTEHRRLWAKEKYNCSCGAIFRRDRKPEHLATSNRHKDFLKNNEVIEVL